MKLASSDARNKAVDAISSGRPSRPNGTAAANWARAWSAPSLVGACWSKIGVSIGPGLIALTRMRRSFNSAVQVRTKERTADGAVGGEAGDALVLGDRCDHDDRPAVIQKRQGLLDCEGEAARVDRKDLVEAFLGRLGEQLRIDDARPGEQDVDLALLAGDLGVEPVEIGEVGHVTLHAATLRPISDTALSSSVWRRPVM